MNRDDLSFLEPMFQCAVHEIQYRIVIVNQSKDTVLKSNYKNIEVVNDPHFGLSRSRNRAIDNATAAICWILDDDCVVVENAAEHIITAHNNDENTIITFETALENGSPYRDYAGLGNTLSRKQIRKVLSPEITFKRAELLENDLKLDLRFGLGAQFGDSENYVFLTDAMDKGLDIKFIPKTIVQHEALTSSDEVTSNRVIYARGALAARESIWTAQIKQLKYVFFLWRKGYVKGWRNLYDKYMVFNHGMNDYLTGFEGHRIGHPDL